MRKWFALLVVLVIFGTIFTVVDRYAVGVAQRRIAAQIQESQNLATQPEVVVRGFPFLTQVVRGRYDEIDAYLNRPPVGDDLKIDALDVRLRGVRLRLADALAGDVGDIPVQSATAVARVSYTEINAVARRNLPKQKSTVTFAQGNATNRLAVSGTYRSDVLRADISAQAELVVENGQLTVQVVPGALDDLPAVLRPQVAQLLARAGRLPELPMGFQATDVTTGPSGVTIRAMSNTMTLIG